MTMMIEINLYDMKQTAHFKLISFAALPGKPSAFWEYKNPSESTGLIPVVPRREQPHIVLPGILVYKCNYGLERNSMNKWKAMERRQKKQNVDHSQAGVSKLQIQRGHKVDCPARICVKETFLLEEYKHVSVSVNCIM